MDHIFSLFVFFLKWRYIYAMKRALDHYLDNYFENLLSICPQYVSFQSIAVPREDWYWPKTDSNDEEDIQNEEEQDVEENMDLTVGAS